MLSPTRDNVRNPPSSSSRSGYENHRREYPVHGFQSYRKAIGKREDVIAHRRLSSLARLECSFCTHGQLVALLPAFSLLGPDVPLRRPEMETDIEVAISDECCKTRSNQQEQAHEHDCRR